MKKTQASRKPKLATTVAFATTKTIDKNTKTAKKENKSPMMMTIVNFWMAEVENDTYSVAVTLRNGPTKIHVN